VLDRLQMSETPMKFAAFYDFRNPAPWRQPWADRYADLLEQIDWVESSTDLAGVSLSEHHFVDDGYLPSVMALAVAVAARTERVEIYTNILQLPLHEPLRVAEDAIAADLISRGRVRLGVAVGYREQEFLGLGTRTEDRRDRMEEALDIFEGAFSGEAFDHHGEHWDIPELTVSPPPHTPGGPEIWIGGTAKPALERAARRASGFLATTNEEVEGYFAACERLGTPPERRNASRNAWLLVEEDPERTLSEIGDHMLYQVNQYIEYGFLKVPPYDDAQVLLDQGYYTLVDAAGAIAEIEKSRDVGISEFGFFAAMPGEPVENGTKRLAYINDKVIPHFAGATV
jgi:hypothetical protein